VGSVRTVELEDCSVNGSFVGNKRSVSGSDGDWAVADGVVHHASLPNGREGIGASGVAIDDTDNRYLRAEVAVGVGGLADPEAVGVLIDLVAGRTVVPGSGAVNGRRLGRRPHDPCLGVRGLPLLPRRQRRQDEFERRAGQWPADGCSEWLAPQAVGRFVVQYQVGWPEAAGNPEYRGVAVADARSRRVTAVPLRVMPCQSRPTAVSVIAGKLSRRVA
jgi:hypothetical protein